MTDLDAVEYRVFPEGDVIAIFINQPYGIGDFLCSYMHIGQHGPVSRTVLRDYPKATCDKYRELAKELYNIGYKVEVP